MSIETRLIIGKKGECGKRLLFAPTMETFTTEFNCNIGRIDCIVIGGKMIDGTTAKDILDYIYRISQLRNDALVYPNKIIIEESDGNTRLRLRNMAKIFAPSFVEIVA